MDDAGLLVARDARRMISVILVLALIMLVGGAFFYRGIALLVFALGVFMTAGTHALKLIWLKHTIAKAAKLDVQQAVNAVRAQYLLRFLLTIVVLVAAGLLSQLEAIGIPIIIGAALGLMTLPVAGYSMHFFIKKDLQQEENNKRQG